jgi:hypothetical protein
VLDLVDQALQALKGAAVPRSSVARAVQRSVQPHADSLAAVATAVRGAIWDVSDGCDRVRSWTQQCHHMCLHMRKARMYTPCMPHEAAACLQRSTCTTCYAEPV